MSAAYGRLMKCLESARVRVDFEPEVALALGSRLGDYAEEIDIRATLDYHNIEDFSVPMIPGHKRWFVFGYVGKVLVVIMQGRVYFHEGYPIQSVVLPARLMKLMGAKALFLTNATDGVDGNFHAGDFMLMSDQANTFVPSPLTGRSIEEFEPRPSDMSQVYNKDLRELIKATAGKLQIPLWEGVYVQLADPAYEFSAEMWMCRVLGADAVGISTACEMLVANHMGTRVRSISFISNLTCGMTGEPLSHKEVQEAAGKVAPLFKELITTSIEKIGAGL